MKIEKKILATDAVYYIEDGDTIEIDKAGEVIKFSCCNCGLTHDFAFKIQENGNIAMMVTKEEQEKEEPSDDYEVDGCCRTIV